jgi:hypothetical protein
LKNDFVVYASAALFLFSALPLLRRQRKKGSYTGELANRIKKISYINDQIAACDDLLLEIHITEPQALKNIPISWRTVAGIEHKADFYISGSGGEVTRKMTALVKARRSELITSLFRELAQLPGTSAREGYENDGEKSEKSRGEGARK